MNYPTIFMDVDNTLIASLDVLSDVNRDALLRYTRATGRIVFATGKVPSALNELIDLLDMEDSWQIAGNGAILFNKKRGEIRTVTKVGKRSRKCIEELQRIGMPFYVYTNTAILKNFETDIEEHDEHFRMLQEPMPQTVADFDVENVLKILMFIPISDKKTEGLVRERMSPFMDGLHLIRTSDFLLEIHDVNQVKSTGMKELAAMEGLDLSQVIAIGDSENDLAMLDAAGYAYVVANASEKIKARGYHVLPSCKDNGVAFLINSLLEKDIQRNENMLK